jgi:hypothetical protein
MRGNHPFAHLLPILTVTHSELPAKYRVILYWWIPLDASDELGSANSHPVLDPQGNLSVFKDKLEL